MVHLHCYQVLKQLVQIIIESHNIHLDCNQQLNVSSHIYTLPQNIEREILIEAINHYI